MYTLNSNHLFLCDRKRAKVQGELGEVAGVLPGQVDGNLVRIAGKLGRPHHHLQISSEELPYIQTLPEAQRTQGIDSLTLVISPAK